MVKFLVALALLGAAPLAQEPVMQRAHSHNDYEQPRPLLDALDQRFGSVEADIFLVEGELLVAHERKDCKPERTLEALYLAPLAAQVEQNGGSVYPGGGKLTLLIDLKDDANATYGVLRPLLAKYETMLTRFSEQGFLPGAVTVVLSGNRPIELVAAEPERLCGIDGRLPDLEAGVPNTLMPMISTSWASAFRWKGEGPMEAEEQAKLKSLIEQAHRGGHVLRFWALPNKPETVWPLLFDAGLDLLNTDDLPKLRAFLVGRAK